MIGQGERPSVARRAEGDGGYEEHGFVGTGERIFASLHVPAGAARAAVVICPAIGHELIRTYRADVHLSRALATWGCGVARLQYRGTGNSDGDPAATTRATMLEDVARARDALVDRVGPVPLFLLGTRFGALVAAASAGAEERCGVALISPVLSADRYFKDGFRAEKTRAIATATATATGAPAPGTPATSPAARLAATGSIELVGATFHEAFHRSWAGRDTAGELGAAPRPVLMVPPGGRRRSDATAVADQLGARGFDVTVDGGDDGDRQWWYLEEREVRGIGEAEGDAGDAGPPVAAAVTRWMGDHARA